MTKNDEGNCKQKLIKQRDGDVDDLKLWHKVFTQNYDKKWCYKLIILIDLISDEKNIKSDFKKW